MPKFLKEITFSGQSTPATPDPGYGSVYIDGPTNLLYYIDDAGVTYDLTLGGTGGTSLYWYAENATPPAVAPIATGTGSIALGNGARALSCNMFVYGNTAGSGATNSCFSNFIGYQAGEQATNACQSNLLGPSAGYQATNANNSNFFGTNAGYQATNACNSNFLGNQAGSQATSAINSNFFGPSAGQCAANANNSNFLSTTSGYYATNACQSNFFGLQAGFQATNANNSNFFGTCAGYYATNASGSTFMGQNAGLQATNANNSNFFGTDSGFYANNSCYSTFIGYQTGKCFISNNLGRNNIIIGTNITLPDTTCDSLNIGGTLFGSELYFDTASAYPFNGVASSGRIGIGIINPTNTLHISGATNPLRIEGLITSANTNYLVANSDGVVTLTSGSSGSDTYVTGFTYNNANTLTIQQNNAQPDLTTSINTMTGLTIIGNLSATTIDTEYIDFTPLTARPTHIEARIYWYNDEKTLELQTENANFNIEVGHQTVVRVRNTTGSPLTKGSLVYINGGAGNNPTVSLASYEIDSDSARTLGFLGTTIPDNQFGYAITNGMVRDINTSAYSAGTQLYLFTGGTYTNVRPIAPLHEVRVGIVIRQSATVGIIFAAIMNGYELGELHDVRATGATNNDLLQYNSSISAWTNTQSIQITSLTANTISATTYQNLPNDVHITGGTYSAGTATFTNTTGGTFNVTGFTTGGTSSSYQVILQAFEESDFVLSGTATVFFRIPSSLNGLNLIECGAQIANTGTTGNTTVMISRGRQSSPTAFPTFVNMLTTAITIEYNIFDSKDSLIPPVIDTSNDDVATGDRIRINTLTTSTGVQGLSITLKFE